MGIPERKERERAELRSLILRAAERLFVRDGYDHVSMRRIAQEIEYSPTTIYRYFKDKSEVMEHLIDRGYRGVHERYKAVMGSPGETPFDTLCMIIREYMEFAASHPEHYHLWHSATELREADGALTVVRGRRSLHVYQVWIELIQECQVSGQLRTGDTLSLFKLIWGCVHGLISLRLQHPRVSWPSIEDQVATLSNLLEKGLSPD